MTLHSAPAAKPRSPKVRLLRGCPCCLESPHKAICANDDLHVPVYVIPLDTSVVQVDGSSAEILESGLAGEGLCNLLILLDKETNRCYCLSHAQILRMNGMDVQAADVERALILNVSRDSTDGGELCSACIRNYLMAITQQ